MSAVTLGTVIMGKMLFCTECRDVIMLIEQPVEQARTCICGKSRGVFLDDHHHAMIVGPAIVLGINNNDLGEILKPNIDVKEAGYWPVRAWRIPDGDRIIIIRDGQLSVPCTRCKPCRYDEQARTIAERIKHIPP